MPPLIATLVFAIGIAGLFYLDRHNSTHTSKALWLPVTWLLIAGSRSVSAWLGTGPRMEILGQLPESSLLDQLVAGTLVLSGVIVLIRRRRDVTGLLKASWPIVLYFSFCLVSLLWSDFPGWGFKRWVRGLGDLVMVLIVVTDAQPTAALRRLFSRPGFVLLPASILLIKYYPEVGRGFSAWGGDAIFNIGVTTNKNALGCLALVVALGTLWQVIELLRDKEQPNRTRRLLAQRTLLAFGIELLFTAHSATSGASFALGAGVMVATALPFFRVRPAAVHALVLVILLASGLTILVGAKAEVVKAMGRNEDLTGRTEIWEIVIPMVNPIGGAGFETFWLGPRVARVFAMVQGGRGLSAANEAHNGYIEVYLNLGCLGVGFIALILGHGYRKAVSAFRRDSALGALLVSYVLTAATYNIGEAGFRMLSLSWFFLLLSVLSASRAIRVGKTPSKSGGGTRRPSPGNSDVLDLNLTWVGAVASSDSEDNIPITGTSEHFRRESRVGISERVEDAGAYPPLRSTGSDTRLRSPS